MQRQNRLDREKRDKKLTYRNKEFDYSKSKSSPQGSLQRSHIFKQMNKEGELLEKSQRTLEN